MGAESDAMVVLKNGNTGIGTSTPSTQLHTTGGVRFENYTDGTLQVDANGNLSVGTASSLFTDGNGLSWSGTTLNSVWTQTGDDISNNNAGNVGIGTSSPFRKLELSGSGVQYLRVSSTDHSIVGYEWYRAGASYYDWRVYNNGGNLRFAYSTDDLTTITDLVTFRNSGNVGIGTTAPAYQLQLSTNSAAKPTSSTWTIVSDGRLKTNTCEYTAGLDSLMLIKPVWFTYTGEAGMPNETGVGVIAQDLQEVAPYMVSEWTYTDENGKEETYLAIDNGSMTYMLINSVQEQQVLIDELIKQNEELILRIKKLEED